MKNPLDMLAEWSEAINKRPVLRTLKNVIKAGVTMFIIGAALGIIAPAAATFLGSGLLGEATVAGLMNTPVLQTGIFFGLFGAASAVVTPVVNYLFGERSEKTVSAKTLGVRSRTLGYEQAPDPSLAHSAAIMHDPSAAAQMMASSTPSPTYFQDMLAAQHIAGVKPPSIG